MDLATRIGADAMRDDVPVRAASTIILVRDVETRPAVLMGQRGKGAIFMPHKYVFPGGAVDDADEGERLVSPLDPRSRRLLSLEVGEVDVSPEALVVAAIRELSEETGLVLERPDALRFFLRAITPPGRPRRFDARFFLAPAEAVRGGPDADFYDSDELSRLHWVPLVDVRALDLANVTAMVLDRLASHLPSLETPDRVPLVRNDRIEDRVIWLG